MPSRPKLPRTCRHEVLRACLSRVHDGVLRQPQWIAESTEKSVLSVQGMHEGPTRRHLFRVLKRHSFRAAQVLPNVNAALLPDLRHLALPVACDSASYTRSVPGVEYDVAKLPILHNFSPVLARHLLIRQRDSHGARACR